MEGPQVGGQGKVARGPSGQWVISFDKKKMEENLSLFFPLAPTELQHPELNYGPGISGELRVTHDSHQEPPGGSMGGMFCCWGGW